MNTPAKKIYPNNDLRESIPIFILNWNGNQDTINCLMSLVKSDLNNFFPVLIDNGSNYQALTNLKSEVKKIFNRVEFFTKENILHDFDKHIFRANAFLKFEDSRLLFIENNENLGFSCGNNIGLIFAKKMNFSWVMLLNNDTIVVCDTFQKLFNFKQKHPEVVAITPQIRLLNNNNIIWNCGGRLSFFGRKKYYFENQDIRSLPKKYFLDIDFITGCALFFNLNETGILSEAFFFGEEDYEFSLRLKKYNKKMVCLLDAVIYHKVGSSIKQNSTILGLIYIHFISRLINTKAYYSHIHWFTTVVLSYLYLPFLLLKSKINPIISFALIFKINRYIKRNSVVYKTEFINSFNICNK